MDQRILKSSTADHKRQRQADAGAVPARKDAAVAGKAMFSGTIHLVNLSFRSTQLGGQITSLSADDLATILQYMTLATPTIVHYTNQYGWPQVTISQQALVAQVDIQKLEYNGTDLKNWVNTMAHDSGIPSSDCICVMNPPEVINTSDSLQGRVGGFHDKANCYYIFVNLTDRNLTLDDRKFAYAYALSHEMAEMFVDPDVGANPEVCDPCAYNCGPLTVNLFQKPGQFIGSVTSADANTLPNLPGRYDYLISGVVQPGSVHACPAPSLSCGYWPEIWKPLGGTGYRELTAGLYADGRLALLTLGKNRDVWKLDELPNDPPDTLAWSGWSSFGGQNLQSLSVASNADGRIEVFSLGGDHAVWHIWQLTQPPGTWGEWSSLGGNGITQLAPVRDSGGVLHVFAVGKGGACFTISQTGPNGGWGAWSPLAGSKLQSLQVAGDGAGVLEVLALGEDAYLHSLKQVAQGGAFGVWNGIQSQPLKTFSSLRDDAGNLHVFALDNQKNAIHMSRPAGAPWGAWEELNGVNLASIAAALNADGRLEVFAIGSDQKIYHRWQAVGGGWAPWVGLGGTQDLGFEQVCAVRSAMHAGIVVAFGLTTAGVPVEINQTGPNGGWA